MGTAVSHHFPRLPGWLSPTKGNRRRFSSKTRKGHEYSTSTFCNEWTQRAAFQKQTKQRNLSRTQSGILKVYHQIWKKKLCWCCFFRLLYIHHSKDFAFKIFSLLIKSLFWIINISTRTLSWTTPRCIGWTKAKPWRLFVAKSHQGFFFNRKMWPGFFMIFSCHVTNGWLFAWIYIWCFCENICA